jgi:SAM-dependent methyltransferase
MGLEASLRRGMSDLACWTCGTTAAPDPRYPTAGYVRCPACDLLFQPSSSRERLREIYRPEYFEDYGLGGSYDGDPAQRLRDARVRVRWVREAGLPTGRLLEVGCASGWFLAGARAVGYDVVGIEPAAEMAAAARERSGAVVHAAMLEDAELAPASFDVAVAWHVLEHLAEPRATLAAVRAALRPGGRLLLELPNAASLRAVRQGEDWYALEPQHHVAHYSPGALDALLRAAGYLPEAIESVHPGTMLLPREQFAPKGLAFQAKEAVSARAWVRTPHPWKFDLLRAVARVP